MSTFTFGTSSASTATYTTNVTRYDAAGYATTDTVAGRTWTSLSARLGYGNSTTADTLVMTGGNDLFAWDDYTTGMPGGALNGGGEYYAFQNSNRTRGIETIIAGAGSDLINLTYEYTGEVYWQWDFANDGANASMWVDGGAGDDIIWGHNPGEYLYGGDGNDWIDGGDGNDSLFGGAKNDSIFGGAGNDLLQGDAGDDTLTDTDGNNRFYGGIGNDDIFGGNGADTMWGGDGNDTLVDSGGANTLLGENGDDVIEGGSGSDYIDGGADSDAIWGMGGTDTIYGGAGSDFIYGGAGNGDTMYGGAGDDYYYFARGDGTGDRIVDSGGTNTIVAFSGFNPDENASQWWVPGAGVTDANGGMIGDPLGGGASSVSISYAAGNVFTLSILGSGAASITADADEVSRIILWNSDNTQANHTQEVFTWNGAQFVFSGYEG